MRTPTLQKPTPIRTLCSWTGPPPTAVPIPTLHTPAHTHTHQGALQLDRPPHQLLCQYPHYTHLHIHLHIHIRVLCSWTDPPPTAKCLAGVMSTTRATSTTSTSPFSFVCKPYPLPPALIEPSSPGQAGAKKSRQYTIGRALETQL